MCNICGVKFSRQDNVLRHQCAKHAQKVPSSECAASGLGFSAKSNLTRHREQVHETKKLPFRRADRKRKAETTGSIRNFACSLCAKRFSTKDLLNLHKKRRHANVSLDKYFAAKKIQHAQTVEGNSNAGMNVMPESNETVMFGATIPAGALPPSGEKARAETPKTVTLWGLEDEASSGASSSSSDYEGDFDWGMVDENDPTMGGLVAVTSSSKVENEQLHTQHSAVSLNFTEKARKIVNKQGTMLRVLKSAFDRLLLAPATKMGEKSWLQVSLGEYLCV